VPAVFGDFVAAADRRLENALLAGDGPAAPLRPITQGLYRLIVVMSRYCDDLAPCDEVEASSRNDLRPWERAVLDAGTALRLAADCLRRGADETASDRAATSSRQARLLAAAATELTAGRDLLETHRASDSAGLWDGRSEWAPVVTSLPITRALGNEIARWSRQLAPFTAQLASSAASYARPRAPGRESGTTLGAELGNAGWWLQAAGAAVRPALEIDPVRVADTELLHAIPAAMVPQRQRPGATAEPVAELCRGITISASRLRNAMQGSKEQARWSPDVTSDGWQWMAQAAAVSSHVSELALRSLAARTSELPSPPLDETRLRAAADFMADMRAAWHGVDRMWDMMITERRRMPASTAMTDASDLVLRIGRLTWDDPRWTPAHSRRAPLRPPAMMAPDADAVRVVIAAVHQAVDAIAVVAETDGDAVVTASAAGRLYVPTRSLPAYKKDVPRPFAPAPVTRRQALQKTYDVALHASRKAADALGELAIAAEAPSRVLAFARAATAAQSNRRGSQSRLDASISRDLPSAGTPFAHARASTGQPGPVEQEIIARGVSDPIVLLRAAAIDNAASRLIAEAGNRTRAAASRKTGESEQRPVRSEVRLAAQNFPDGLSARPPAQQPSRSAGQPGSSPHRIPGRVRQPRSSSL
jgi:hypothetical protein